MELHVATDFTLRPVHNGDAETLFELVEKNRSHLGEFLGWVPFTQDVEDTRAFIETANNKETLTLGILFHDKLVGLVGFQAIDPLNHSANIGYWLDADMQRRGIMTRSVEALIRYGFDTLDLIRIEIRCITKNVRSAAIPKRLGFEKEGLARQAIWVNGSHFDAEQYSLIRRQS